MVKKKRKPLSEAQKQERRERLAVARDKKPEPKYVSVASNVRELEDSHPLSLKNTRKHIRLIRMRDRDLKRSLELLMIVRR